MAGGSGGSGFGIAFGGAGGSGPDGGAGQAGSEDRGAGGGGGGGGAGSGASAGGAGGNSGGGAAGGAGGTALAPDGKKGDDSGSAGAGGGGGGYSALSGPTLENAATLVGGKGGAGGIQTSSGLGGGGGGGEGGYGAVVTSAGPSTNTGSLTGGAGGKGGDSAGAFGGNGGSGGVGVLFTAPGSSLDNSGTIAGGQGGGGSSGAFGIDIFNGAGGPGGVGVSGANLTIVNSGTISGGLPGDGNTANRADAITFTGGTLNRLTLGGTLDGGLGVTGTLTLVANADQTLDNVIHDASGGAGALVYGSAATLTLSGANTYSGGTTISAGTLAVSADSNLGASTGGLALTGGTLEMTTGFTTNRAVTISGAGTVVVDSGGGEIDGKIADGTSGAGTLTVGGPGTLTLGNAGNTYSGGTTISAGTLAVSADGNLGASTGGLALTGGTLEMTTGFTTNRAVTISGAGTVVVDSGGGEIDGKIADGTSGAGTLTVGGPGTLTLGNAGNSYSGGTVIAGILLVSDDGNLGDAAGGITFDGTNAAGLPPTLGITADGFETSRDITISLFGSVAVIDPAGSATLSGDISGDGSDIPSSLEIGVGSPGLPPVATGRVILTGDNTYNGGTFVSGATVAVAADGNLGAAPTNGRGLITGTVNLYHGTLELTADGFSSERDVFLFESGTLQTDVGTATLAGVIHDGFGGGPVGSARSAAAAAPVSDGNALIKTGAGTLVLSGANTYAGGTTLSAGTLVLDHAATLDQNGAIESAAAGTGAIHFGAAPGSSVTLALTANADPGNGNTFANTLDDLGTGEFLDLYALTYAAGVAASYENGVLTVAGKGVSESFTLDNTSATIFAAVKDGRGGTLVGTGTLGQVSANAGETYDAGNHRDVALIDYGASVNAAYAVTTRVVKNHAEVTVDNGTFKQTVDLGATPQSLGLDFSDNVAAVSLSGGAYGDSLKGGAGADRLNGRAGADTMAGGDGNDIYYVDDAGDTVIEALSDTGKDTILTSVGYALSDTQSIEVLRLVSATGTQNLDLAGNAFDNRLIGNAGNNDLDGKGGADRMEGGLGDDTYHVDDIHDVVVESMSGSGGNDTVITSVSYRLGGGRAIETLKTSDAAGTDPIDLSGNEFDNTLIGNDGANKLNGRGGVDTMEGGKGNDTYTVDDSRDTIVETADASGGDDTLIVTTNFYSLADGVGIETLRMVSTAGMGAKLNGNDQDQRVVGNAFDNELDGKLGNDVLQGLGGDDAFLFTTALGAHNVDHIRDFGNGGDSIHLSNAVFGLGLGRLSSDAFAQIETGTATVGTDAHILYERKTGTLYYDADGGGAANRQAFSVLDNHHALSANDFLVIA